ncbi:uncharacterized protein [Battus philenor]|uniref:uncharacterized protein n=1 Tax=Battus philenor TaxID=42288 RepID=UPI0035CF97ED
MFQIFLILCKALIILELLGTLASNVNGEENNYSDASLISFFLENILNLGIKSLRDDSAERTPGPNVRRCDKQVVQSLIKNKVKELRHLLQDNDYNETDPDENLTLKGEDETTIVELVSDSKDSLRQKESFKQSIKKYKRLRRIIHNALLKESVSSKTITLIIRTIDEMIAKMIASRCSWKRNNREKVLRVNTDNIFGVPAAWNFEWLKLKEKYSDLFQSNQSLPQKQLDTIMNSLMEKMPSFFANVLRDGELLAKEYNVKCQKISESDLVETKLTHQREVTDNNSRRYNAFCKTQIWMCSGELQHFLMYIYKSFNTITSKVLSDYLEMYKIDVNIDKVYGHKGIVSRLREIGYKAANEVCTIYVNEIEKFAIDTEKQSDSIKALLYFIDNITDKVKMHTNEVIRFKMKPMDTELKERILRDIDSNLKIELDKLSVELKRTICLAFETCNGRYTVQDSKKTFAERNSVFVRVIVKLDDDMKHDLYKNSKRMFGFPPDKLNLTSKTTFRINQNRHRKSISVTRTTIRYNSSYKINYNYKS